MNVSIFLRIIYSKTAAFSYAFLRHFAGEIGAQASQINLLAHPLRLTAVLYTAGQNCDPLTHA